jgi:hypothetical protein
VYCYFMAKIKLGIKEFDVDSDVIRASGCRVSDADCAALGARMRDGEFHCLGDLRLVRLFCSCYVFATSVSGNVCRAGRQPNKRRWSQGDC